MTRKEAKQYVWRVVAKYLEDSQAEESDWLAQDPEGVLDFDDKAESLLLSVVSEMQDDFFNRGRA